MSTTGLVWIGVGVVVMVFLDILFMELRKIIREAGRILNRLQGYGDLPLWSLLAAGGADVERIARASDDIPALIGRGQLAVATLQGAVASLRRYLPKGTSPG